MAQYLTLRSGVLDFDVLDALQRFVLGDAICPADLAKIETGLRAMLLVDQIRATPVIATENSLTGFGYDVREDDSDPPIGDGVLDYEFIYEPGVVPPLPELSEDEIAAIDELVWTTLGVEIKETTNRINELMYSRRNLEPLVGQVEAALSGIPSQYFDGHPNNHAHSVEIYAHTLIRFHRVGAVVFSETIIGQACQKYLFSKYPLQLFDQLDNDWEQYLRKVIGPGIGVTVPPILACVLSRVERRLELSGAIRDLREEYASSRKSLWDHLEEMWSAATLKKQLRLLSDLEKAGRTLFAASFPDRFPFLQTAWSTGTKIAALNPISALDEIGKSMLSRDAANSSVSAIGFTKQLSKDLRHVGGMSDLLRKVLSRAEAARFGIR